MNSYTFHINLYHLAFLGAIFIGLTFAILLWFTNTVNRSANRFLAMALATMILWMIRILAIDLGLEIYLPRWDWLPMQALLVLGPFMYFYVLKITCPEYQFKCKDLLHFSPLLLEQAAQALEIKESARTGAATYVTHTFQQLNPVLQLLVFTSIITYLRLSGKLIQKFYRRLQPVLMDRPLLEFRWLRRLLLAAAYGWRAPFYVNGMLGLIWVLVCWLWFRNHPGEMKGISQEEKELIELNRNYVKHERPFSWKLVLANPMMWALFLSYFACQWANYFFSAWLPTYLQDGKHFSEQQMKTTTTLVFSVGILSAFVFGIVSDRLIKIKGISLARKSIAGASFGVMAVAIFLSTQLNGQLPVTCSYIVADFCLMFIVLSCFSTCVDIGGDRVSTITCFMNFIGQTGSFLMSMIFGKIVDRTHNYEMPQYLMLALLVIGGICWFKIDASKKIIDEPAVSIIIPSGGSMA